MATPVPDVAHGDAHVCRGQRRGIVDPVADHRHHPALSAWSSRRAATFSSGSSPALHLFDSQPVRDPVGRGFVVARDHHGLRTPPAAAEPQVPRRLPQRSWIPIRAHQARFTATKARASHPAAARAATAFRCRGSRPMPFSSIIRRFPTRIRLSPAGPRCPGRDKSPHASPAVGSVVSSSALGLDGWASSCSERSSAVIAQPSTVTPFRPRRTSPTSETLASPASAARLSKAMASNPPMSSSLSPPLIKIPERAALSESSHHHPPPAPPPPEPPRASDDEKGEGQLHLRAPDPVWHPSPR